MFVYTNKNIDFFWRKKMKKIAKTLFVFAAAAALVIAITGCKDPDPDPVVEKKPPTGIAVKNAGADVSSLTIELNDTVQLTVSATGATGYYWDVKSGSPTDIVTLTNDSTATVSIEGKKAGSTKIVAYAENKDGTINKEINITVQPHVPQLIITKIFVDGEEISAEEVIEIIEGEHATLTFEIKDDDNTVVTDANVQVISGDSSIAEISTTSGIQVEGKAEGDTTITITASKSTHKPSDSITMNVSVDSAAGHLLLDVDSGSTGTWDGDTLTIFDDANLTLSVTGKVDGVGVTLTSKEWEVTDGNDIVTINSSTGDVTILKKGMAIIRVDAETSDKSAHKTITLVVKSNVLFDWDKTSQQWTLLSQSDNAVIGKVAAYSDIGLAVYGGNNAPVDNGGIKLTNVRLVIGQTKGNGTSGVTATNDTILTDRGGQFDLSSRPFKATIDYESFSGGWIRFSLRNNTTGQNTNSVMEYFAEITSATFPTTATAAGTGKTYQYAAGSNASSGTLILDIDPAAAYSMYDIYPVLQSTFFSMATQSTTNITITGIKLEYTGDAGQLTALKLYNGTTGAIIPADMALEKNGTLQLLAKEIPASPNPSVGHVVWSVDSGTTVSVSADGLVTAGTTAGVTTIKAAIGSVDTTVDIDVLTDPTGIVISGIGVQAGTPKTLELNLAGGTSVTAQLTANILPPGITSAQDITWTTSDSSKVEVGSTGGTVTITAKAVTTGTPVTITATLVDGGTFTDTVDVTVVNNLAPAVIWEWKSSVNPIAAGGISSGGSMTVTGYTPVIYSIGAAALQGNNSGIKLGAAAAATGAPRFVIGKKSNAASTASDTLASVNGEFQLLGKKTYVTITYQDITQAGTQMILAVSVNNTVAPTSATNRGACIFTPTEISMIKSYSSTTTLQTDAGSASTTSGTVTIEIDATAGSTLATHANAASLDTAYIAIYCQQGNATVDNYITITAIEIKQ
jgi:hypothetical protein